MEGEGEAGLTTVCAIAETERELKLFKMWTLSHYATIQNTTQEFQCSADQISTSKKLNQSLNSLSRQMINWRSMYTLYV